nr:DUF1128 domain-containing protein [Bacillus sp. FJAT-49711]
MREDEMLVDLSKNTPENIEYMVNEIVTKMKMVNIGAIKSESMDSEMYEELHEIYEMVMKKDNFSPSEMQALAEELGRLRKV